MFCFMVEFVETLRQAWIERKSDEPAAQDELRRAGLLERAVNALGDGLIALGQKIKSLYADADSQSSYTLIRIE